MKKILLAALLLFSVGVYSQCPKSAKRNNGQGVGCPGTLTLIYDVMPTNPAIDSMYVNGVKEATPPYLGVTIHDHTFQLIYCLDKNFPPVSYFKIWKAAADPTQPCGVITGGPLAVKIAAFNSREVGTNEYLVTLTTTESLGENIFVKFTRDNGTYVIKPLYVPAGATTFSKIIKL